MFELVKNSLRAVHDRFEDSDHASPPIRIVVAEGEEDITIKVGRLFFLYVSSIILTIVRVMGRTSPSRWAVFVVFLKGNDNALFRIVVAEGRRISLLSCVAAVNVL